MKVSRGTVQADELIAVIKDSLQRVGLSATAESTDLRLSTVRLTIRAVAARAAGGGVDIRVPVIGMQLKAGIRMTRQDVHIVDITMEPPPEDSRKEIRDGNVEDALVAAITTIRSVVASAAVGDNPWMLRGGCVDLSFVVTDTGSLAIGAEGELANELTHTLHLCLSPNGEVPTKQAH